MSEQGLAPRWRLLQTVLLLASLLVLALNLAPLGRAPGLPGRFLARGQA